MAFAQSTDTTQVGTKHAALRWATPTQGIAIGGFGWTRLETFEVNGYRHIAFAISAAVNQPGTNVISTPLKYQILVSQNGIFTPVFRGIVSAGYGTARHTFDDFADAIAIDVALANQNDQIAPQTRGGLIYASAIGMT